MAPSLIELMEELLQSIEQRDAGDPDAPAWEACARIRRLEDELARRLSAGDAETLRTADEDRSGPQAGRPDEVLAGVG